MMPIKDPIKKRENHRRYMREVWYPKNKTIHLALVQRARTDRRNNVRRWLDSIKSNKGCIDCKIKDFRVLEFDHLGSKEFGISFAVGYGKTRELILREIEKCDVVCSNCHRIRTWMRKNAGATNGGSGVS